MSVDSSFVPRQQGTLGRIDLLNSCGVSLVGARTSVEGTSFAYSGATL